MYAMFFKRAMDFTLSVIALIVLSPVLLALIIVGAIVMKGNPFFLQPRPGKKGKDGKEKIFKFVNYIDYEKDISEFWNKNKDKIKDFYIKQQQNDDVIISASPRFVLAPICKELGIDNLICSEVDVHSGKYNGENCHGEEKVVRFRAIYKEDKVDKFYSDSRSDTPMALISEEPFIIKGNKIKPWN